MEKKLLLQELADILVAREGISKRKAEAFIKSFFEVIERGIETDKYVKVKGFGTFKLIAVSERESVNISTGERFQISGHSKITFTPDTELRDLINRPFAHFQTVALNDETSIEELEAVDTEVEVTVDTIPESNTPTDDRPETKETHSEPEESLSEQEKSFSEPEEKHPVSDETISEPEENLSRSEADRFITKGESTTTPTAPTEEEETGNVTEYTKNASEDAATEDKDATTVTEDAATTDSSTAISTEEKVPHPTPVTSETSDTAATTSNVSSAPPISASVAPVTVPDRFNWWKAIVIFIAIFLLMIASYFAGYFRLFCPCEFLDEWQARTGWSSRPTAPVPTPTTPVPAPSVRTEPDSTASSEEVGAIHTSSTTQAPPSPANEQPATSRPAEATPRQTDTATQSATVSAPTTTTSTPSAKRPVRKNKAQPARQAQVPGGKYVITGTRQSYTMSRGETIRSVAEYVYGSKGYAPYIIAHNHLSDPDHIAVGTVIQLPELERAQ